MGTSILQVALVVNIKDHPHACGDKLILISDFSRVPGSSPRVWGQGKKRIIVPSELRIIPTRVGTR